MFDVQSYVNVLRIFYKILTKYISILNYMPIPFITYETQLLTDIENNITNYINRKFKNDANKQLKILQRTYLRKKYYL